MDLITYALCKKHGGESITYTLTADTENKTIVLTPSEGTAQVITVPYATDASTVNGHEVPELENGKIPANFLPSFVDNVDEYDNISLFPVVGESNRIYIDKSTNKTYRWSGTAYVEISESIALGETSSTAYRGDRGKIAYDHSQSAHAPSNAEANQNAFSKVKIDSDIINASAKTDTLEFIAGDNIILTPNVSNKKITVSQVPVRKTASGDIASFSDGTGDPFLEVKANINPVQDLHGYDYPWVGGAGKNKYNKTNYLHAYITSDNTIQALSAGTLIYAKCSSNTTYTVSKMAGARFIVAYCTDVPALSVIVRGIITDNTATSITVTTDAQANYIVAFVRNEQYDSMSEQDMLDSVQIELGSSATSYAPYSNICPISGHTEANVTVADDLTTPTETHTLSIPFHDNSDNPITVYGGTLNVTSGELRVTYGKFDMGTINWNKTSSAGHFYGTSDNSIFPYKFSDNTKMMCEIYKFDGVGTTGGYYGVDGTVRYWYSSSPSNTRELYVMDNASWDAMTAEEYKRSVTGKYIVYELATPQTYQLTPAQVSTLLGQNNIFADCGDIEVAYKTPFYTDLTTKNEVQVLINESITSALNASY